MKIDTWLFLILVVLMGVQTYWLWQERKQRAL